jgi:ubiquinone/menaquinone biosynthesis C-methylase UbiE
MNFSSRSYEKELLDRDDIPFEAIRRNMEELDTINTWLGGHDITLSGLKKLVKNKKEITICEIGCGGGDNLSAISKWCINKNITAKTIGIDINPSCIAMAKSKSQIPNSEWRVSDYRLLSFENEKPGIIFSSLFCHHFKENELVSMLRWMRSNSTTGFFINDLHRHPLAYYSIKILTSLFSKSYLVKNDAPLSVMRGFSKSEWLQLLQSAAITNYSIRWKWAFRWLIISSNNRGA